METRFRSSLLIMAGILFLSIESFAGLEDQFVDFYQKAKAQKLTFLPDYLDEKKKVCIMYSNEEYKNCLEQAIEHAKEVLECPNSKARFQQGIEYDRWFSQETFLKNKKIEVPASLGLIFKKLIQNLDSIIEFKLPIQFSIEAYQSSLRNAHAAIDGKIYMSSGLWQSEPKMSDPEIAAVIAHELAHVIKGHGALLNCLALEWTNSKMTIQFAQETFNEDLRGSVRFEKWSAVSQNLELEADRVATQILKKAGLSPLLMSEALIKLRPKETGGMTSGSHPDFEKRIKLAIEASDSL